MNNKNDEKEKSYQDYMERVGKESIPCYEPTMGEQEIEFLTDVVNRNWLSENKYTREFEHRLAKICERKYSIAFCNATSALISGMKSYNIGNGDEVIVPSFTHPADPNSISVTGASPVFADVDYNTLCMSVDTIKQVVTNKTKAILFVSLYGNAEGIDKVEQFAKENNIVLINDCAAALCGKYKNKSIASYGDFSVLSFFADKTITTGEGGMFLTDNEELVKDSNFFKHDGRRERGYDLIEKRGYNFRITELQTAVGVAQLNKLDGFIKRKKEILIKYKELLSDFNEAKLFKFTENGDIVPHRIIILVKDAKLLIEYLSSKGIGVRTMFWPMHSQPVYNTGQNMPVTEKLFKEGICLPSAPSLTDQDIEFVCDSIKQYFKK